MQRSDDDSVHKGRLCAMIDFLKAYNVMYGDLMLKTEDIDFVAITVSGTVCEWCTTSLIIGPGSPGNGPNYIRPSGFAGQVHELYTMHRGEVDRDASARQTVEWAICNSDVFLPSAT